LIRCFSISDEGLTQFSKFFEDDNLELNRLSLKFENCDSITDVGTRRLFSSFGEKLANSLEQITLSFSL